MNILQSTEYEMLIEIDRICKMNNIPYYLAYGSALGAVRHKGFIPWDDDIDIIMLRDDYKKFGKLVQKELRRDMFFQNVYTDKEYPFPFSKVRKNGTAYVECGMETLHIHHGIFIDIFPLDYIPKRRLNRYIQRIYAEWLWLLMSKNRNVHGIKRCLVSLLNLGLTEDKYLKRIRTLEEKIECKASERSSQLALMSYGGRARYAKEYFEANDFIDINIEFEGKEFSIMSGYDNFLKIAYGDYMQIPPEDKRVKHQAFYVNCEKEYVWHK